MIKRTTILLAALVLPATLVSTHSQAQSPFSVEGRGPAPLDESGKVTIDGQPTQFLIRHLPASSFPELPQLVQQQLSVRGCLIPQTYQARRPENVVHASLEGPASSDWAVLCSSAGKVSLIVFFGSGAKPAIVLASAPETERLQTHDTTGVLGFNWGIDPASPRRVAETQAGMDPRPPHLDHDALADSVVDRKTIYHFYTKNSWTLVPLPE